MILASLIITISSVSVRTMMLIGPCGFFRLGLLFNHILIQLNRVIVVFFMPKLVDPGVPQYC